MSVENTPRKEDEIKPCTFCKIREMEELASEIVRTNHSFAIMSLEGHPMVIPNSHVTLDNMDEFTDEIEESYKLALSLVTPTMKGLSATGINIVTNLGRAAGQDISHVHIHLIGRETGDGKVKFATAPPLEREELNLMAGRIKEFLK